MKQRITTLLFACLLLLPLAGCSSKEEAKTLDLNAFTKSVLDAVEYDDELTLLPEGAASDYYNIPFDGLKQYVVYVSGTMATSNELAVFEVENADALKAAQETAEARLNDLIESYENYRPDELARLNNALILSADNYLLFSVSNDNDTVSTLFTDSLK